MAERKRTLRRIFDQGNLLPRIINRLNKDVDLIYSYIGMVGTRHPARVAVLYGRNDDEENLLALALVLSGSYTGRIVMLVTDEGLAKKYLQTIDSRFTSSKISQIELIHKTKKNIRRFHFGSEIVITSHIILSSRSATKGRVHVHVSHGLGPKTYRNPRSSEVALVSNSRIWNEAHLQAMHKPLSTRILTGMPREDLFSKLPQGANNSLVELNIDPSLPFVVWVPTFRTTLIRGKEIWSEGLSLADESKSNAAGLSQLLASARSEGVQVIVKPHPVEASTFNQMGLKVLSNKEIWDSGLSIYQLLGLANGLISDYSSIWVDYLSTRRPIGLYCPDIEYFENGPRGLLGPSYSELTDGLLLKSSEHFDDFFKAVATGNDSREAALEDIRRAIGYVAGIDDKAEKLCGEILKLCRDARVQDFDMDDSKSG